MFLDYAWNPSASHPADQLEARRVSSDPQPFFSRIFALHLHHARHAVERFGFTLAILKWNPFGAQGDKAPEQTLH